MAASILHADLDAFFAAVEQRDRPELRGRPVIVGTGVVMAASYEARAVGVRSAMGGVEARRRCPGAIVVPPRMEAYAAASRAVMACFSDVTPAVEPVSIDEAFLDVTGALRLLGAPRAIAERLRNRVRDEIGLPLSIGVARTKYLAKVASAQAKPDGLVVVEPDAETAFLHPLGVEVLWGVGPVTTARLRDRGMRTVGDLARADQHVLVALLGRSAGRHLRALAHHHDPRPVRADRRDRTMGAQRALTHRRRSLDELRTVVRGLVDSLGRRLRTADLVARTVTVRHRDGELRTRSRRVTLDQASDAGPTLAAVAVELLDALCDGEGGAALEIQRRGCTLVAVTLSGLGPRGAVQLSLGLREVPGHGHAPRADGSIARGRAHLEVAGDRSSEAVAALDRALDRARDRWGRDVVTRASLMSDRGGVPVAARPTAIDA